MRLSEMVGMEVRVTGNTYTYAKKLKSCGFRFDAATKSWIGKVNQQATHALAQDDLVVRPLASVLEIRKARELLEDRKPNKDKAGSR